MCKTKFLADRIYNQRGYESQIKKFKEEFAELHLALIRFINLPIEVNMKNLVNEIADYELVKIQLDRNTFDGESCRFMVIASRHSSFIEKEGLKNTLDRVKALRHDEIEKSANFKANRTLKRIKEGYYD